MLWSLNFKTIFETQIQVKFWIFATGLKRFFLNLVCCCFVLLLKLDWIFFMEKYLTGEIGADLFYEGNWIENARM